MNTIISPRFKGIEVIHLPSAQGVDLQKIELFVIPIVEIPCWGDKRVTRVREVFTKSLNQIFISSLDKIRKLEMAVISSC